MRTFVALEAAGEIREALGCVQEKLVRTGAKVKWTKPDNLHLTLKFLGEIDNAQAESMRVHLREVARQHAPFDIEFAGIGTFPRVVWAGCRGRLDRLISLAKAAESCADRIGIPAESRPFRAHLTIGRTNGRVRIPEIGTSFGKQIVDEFVLMKSERTPQGPIYTPVEVFRLTAKP